MKRTFVLAVCLPFVVAGALILTPSLFAAPGESADAEQEIKELKRELDSQTRELREFKNLIESLADYRETSSNTDRYDAIGELQEAMKTYILRREKELGETRSIIQHGEEPREYDHSEPIKNPSYTSDAMEGAIKLGGEGRDPELYRLARSQQLFITCKRIRVEAGDGTDWAFRQYYEGVVEFAGIMNNELHEKKRHLETLSSEASMGD